MTDQKDQHSDTPPTDESTRLPLKKRGYAEKTLPRLNNDGDCFFPTDKDDMKPDVLRKNAYYDALKAFSAESSAVSAPRIMLIKELKSALYIDQNTHTDLQKKIKADSLVQELRGTSIGSSEKEKVTDAEDAKSTSVEGEAPKPRLIVNKQHVLKLQESFNVAPAKIQQETAEPSATTTPAKIQKEKADANFPSWGHVSPESLVNNIITISIDGEEDCVTFKIKAYDPVTEMHQLVPLSRNKEVNDPLDWIDIRYFPREDIIWQHEHPGFTTRNSYLKPGQTLLNATATSREKTPIREVGRSASGIPIIKKLDKGKAIVQ
ncbi:unnamed protein product [Eruca vesicaria subsp. sativa]|uniref:ENT domain-containing protein n=1 Tax=Eruca vesicaria subsp. sativa TaxID=29727 RepID=A0ABC8KTH5_ERUVS|nr:unnamed protein product [Eruca vesicaria subsp. sativa]